MMTTQAPSLSILNPNPQRIPGPSLLHQLVRNAPHHGQPAIDYQASDKSHTSLSYPELHSRAEHLAKRILGALPESESENRNGNGNGSGSGRHGPQQLVVPLLLPQCPELYISQLAILKAGGAFCPLNLDAPPERVKFILRDVSATVIITTTTLRSKIDDLESHVRVIVVDQDDDAQHDLDHVCHLGREATADSLAYVMYTSGSTGTPKGVGISHDAATQALLGHDRHIPYFSRFLQFAAPTFDVSVFEVFFPMFRGATLVCCSRADMLNDLPAVLRNLRVDACELTPTVAGSLLRSRDNVPDLRLLLTIGEMLTGPVIKEFGRAEHKSGILWAMYGPTEATIHCTLQPSCEASSSPNNVGFPLDTVSAFILAPLGDDDSGHFEVLPYGATGELAIGGHQTAVGYINRPEQTSKVFIDTPHGRLYRTGDKARMRENGTIDCFGRISDGQVKLRGQRTELGEIEQAVLHTSGCHGAVASIIKGIIVVFCESDDPNDHVAEEVLQTCRNWLPVFMVPGDVVFMKSFPRLPSGKIDRKQLKTNYEMSRTDDSASPTQFADDVERELAGLAQEALGIHLQPSSILTAAGMDSLAAIKLASRLRRAGFSTSAVDILSCKTISQLRSRIRRQRGRADSAVEVEEPSTRVDSTAAYMDEISKCHPTLDRQISDIEAVVPCAPMQVSMLAETLINREAYCNWIELHVSGAYPVETISLWFRDLARNNEALRTGFAAFSGQIKQIIWKELGASQIRTVEHLDRRYRLDEEGFFRPFSVQIRPRKPSTTSVLLHIHHALYDGWSFDMLLSDLNILAQGGQPAGRPSFRLVSNYYQSAEFSYVADTARAYWAEYLLGYQPTAMPQMLAKQKNSGQVISAERKLNVEASFIKQISIQLEISPQVLFQTCLLYLWGSILGTKDVVIGNVTSGRTIPVMGIEDVMGPCLTTTPLRSRIGQVHTIRELLESIHASNREILAHCTLPLADIKKAAGIMPGQPLYDALFVYQESLHSREGRQQPETIKQVAHEDYLETKLLAEIEPLGTGFQFRITYHDNVFHPSHMQMFLRQFECILEHVVKNLDSDMFSITRCFADNVLSQYNCDPKTLEGTPDLATLFERTAAKAPGKTAICFAEDIGDSGADLKTISYGDLNSQANRIARLVLTSGASEGNPVAIVMEKSIMLYAGILGILKAGCAYLPLLPSTPRSRIRTIFEQANVRLCISEESSRDALPVIDGCRFISLHGAKLNDHSEENLETLVDSSRVANIIYTSGSTGVPKGVCVTQLNIASNLDVLSRIYPVKENSRMLQACSQAFDVSVFEILFALTRGMCLCAATNDVLFADLERSIATMGVTHLSMTPTVASLVRPQKVPKVEFLVTSGEPMTSEVARHWVGKLYQGYGPSETTNICSVKKMTPEDHIRHLGFAFENTSAFILAPASLDVLPICCVGELCFGGDQVVAGYLNLPAVTNEKFIKHPRYGRLYRSGDMGRMLPDGSLLIVGRVDDQIKLRGQRIELGEINSVVATAREVANCVTVLVSQGQQLVCYYVPSDADGGMFHVLTPNSMVAKMNEAIYGSIRSRLPGYMVPSYLIPISTIPMTSSGKIDKNALREVFGKLNQGDLEVFCATTQATDSDGDWCDEERKVATVVANVLNASPRDIRRWTPLTSLGLDSISAISVAKGLQSILSLRVSISAILQNPCVAKLAALFREQQIEIAMIGDVLDVFPPELAQQIQQKIHNKYLEVEKILPCTPLQEAMLAVSTSDTSYLNRMVFRLNVDAAVMMQAWITMFQRHGILRTCFFSTDDREHSMAQCVLKSWEPEWLSFNVAGNSLDAMISKQAEAISAVIDSGEPPISLAVIKNGANTHLSFICHHALYDGVAISRLLEEIEQVALGVQLPPPPSYEPFLREMLSSSDSTDAFWTVHLENLRTKSLARASDAQAGRDVLINCLDIPLSNIDQGLKILNASLLPLLQAVWANVLRIILNSDDVCFGNVFNGRTGTVDRVDELIAPCFNTIPARVDIQSHKCNNDLLKSFQHLGPQLLQYQYTPLRRIQSLFSTNGTRLFDTLLLLQQPPRKLDERFWTLDKDDGEINFPLVCEVTPLQEPGTDRLEIKIHFDRSSVSDAYASFIFDTMSHILSAFLQFPSSHIISKESLPSALRQRLEGLQLVYPEDELRGTHGDTDADECWTRPEQSIRSILSKISGVKEDRIGRHMTIFQLGLDSINAVQVAAILRRERFPSVTATDILENPTCSKLAATLSADQLSTEDLIQYNITEFDRAATALLAHNVPHWRTIEAIFPCTSLQMGMLTEFINSRGKDYFNFISFRVNQGVTVSNLLNAWTKTVKAHAILRTGFTPLDHPDASFAMLGYTFADEAVPVTVKDNADKFDLTLWQLEASQKVFNNLHEPPWLVALVPNCAQIDMHLAIHHAIYDAQSLQMIMVNLARALREEPFASGTGVSSVVQNIVTQTKRSKEVAKEFWEKQASKTVINKFPVMTPLREERRSIEVRSRTCSLPFATLEDATKNAGLTIHVVAQAAWLRILSSYLGEASVVFGTILSGRDSETTCDAVFPCITTLPIIAQNSLSNRELLDAMMEYNTGLRRQQRTPLTDIQRWLGHPNTKLFDTLLVYQKFQQEGEQHVPWSMVDEKAMVDYPVSLEVEPQAGFVELRVTFISDVLPAEQAEILLRQFDAVFCELAQHPNGSEDDLVERDTELFAVLPAEEPQLESNVTFLHQFVEFSARKYPEKTALDFVSGFENEKPLSRKWTYRELDESGNKIANMLSSHTTTGDIVAVCFEKCPEAHFSMLGILKAGCTLLALDPGAPSSRKEFILQDSGASVLLTDRQLSSNMTFNVTVPVIAIDEESLAEASASLPKLTRTLSPGDRSYCLYTSGTTGTPKGCEITHENAVQAMLAFQKLFERHCDQDSKWLQFASYHFDVSVLEQYWTWSVGITLVAAPRDVILEDLAGTISRLEITHIDLTPSLARLLHPDDVPSLCRGVFITGGEQLKQEILDVWGPERVIHNFYGPTEATIGVTTYPCVPINGRSSNIGRQFTNVGSYVLRPDTEIPVLRGGVGELCVSGKLVGAGYLNRKELTAEKFPTLGTFKERVYRTGDLVRVLHDGCFDFLGRADDQVKLRGQRLEIGEINHCIRTGVRGLTDVVTLVIGNQKQQKDLLVSFVVTSQQQKESKDLQVISGDEAASISHIVQQACRERLPGYMVPTYVLLLPFIPLSPNNKAEMKELRALFNQLSPSQLVAPSPVTNADLGGTGRKVCKALSNITGVAEEIISPSTNIFELGVDSISVMRFVRALKQEGIKATPAVILRNPTVTDLAQAFQSSQKSTKSTGVLEARQAVEACQHRHRGLCSRALGVKPDEIEYIAPCSPLQHGMISRSRTEDNEGAYFNTFRFELTTGVEVEKLRSAWTRLVEEHSVLRTRFVSTTDGFVQAAMKTLAVPWDEIEMLGDDDLEAVLAGRRKAWIMRNNQTIDRPLEFLLVKGDGKQTLVVHIFHAIYDANSFELMVDEVTRIYKDKAIEALKAPSFVDALLHGPLRNLSTSKSFWMEHLKGAGLSSVPRISGTPSTHDLSISRSIHFEALDKLGRTLGVTQQAVIQAIWGSVLQKHCSYGVTFGIIVSGRSLELEDVDKTIGPLFNTIPFHRSFQHAQTWSSAFQQCHEFNTAILPFQHVPLRDIQKWCSGGKPIFDTLFSFQRASSISETGGEGLWMEIEGNVNPDYPLAFEATLMPSGELRVLIVSQKGIADEESLQALIDDFETMASNAIQDPQGLVMSGLEDGVATESRGNLSGSDVYTTYHGLTRLEEASFEWTPQAETIRKEITVLVDMNPSLISQNTTLLELGLDSIDTIKLSARLRREGIPLSNSELVKGQSIANFMAILQAKHTRQDEPQDSGYSSDVEDSSLSLKTYLSTNGYHLDNIVQALPPTPLQDSMMSKMIQSDFRTYFNHDVLELSPGVDVHRLKEAWMTVIKHSPVLRTAFVEVESPAFEFAYAQLIVKDSSATIHEVSIQSLDEISSIMEQARVSAQGGHGRSNLFQVTFAVSSDKTYIVLSIAHALYDGWSLGLLHQDVESAYHGTYIPRDPYTEYLGEILRSCKDGAREFWSDYVCGAVPTLFPIREDTTGTESALNRTEFTFATSASALKSFCRRQAISQQAVAQACWAAILAIRCKRLDVSFGTVLSGRDTEASEKMLFPTMNTVPVRAVLYGSVSTFLRYIQDNMTSIRQFQHFPLRKIQALMKEKGEGLFNTLFILQNSGAGKLKGEQLMKSVEGASAAEYAICVEMEVIGDKVVWRTACDDGYLSSGETMTLLQELDSVLNFLVTSPDGDVLKFGEKGVSVCGFPAFQPQEAITAPENNQPEEGDDDNGEAWSPTEEAIREVLAAVSGTGKATIRKSHNLYHLGLDSISAIKVSLALRNRGVMDDDASNALATATSLLNVDMLLRTAGIDAAEVEEIFPATAMQTHMLSVWQNTRGAVFHPEFHYRLSSISNRKVIGRAWRRLVEELSILRTIFIATGSRTTPVAQVVLRAIDGFENPFVSLKVEHMGEEGSLLGLKIHHALYDGVSLPKIMDRFQALLGHHEAAVADGHNNDILLSLWKGLIASSLTKQARENRKGFWAQYLQGVKSTPVDISHGMNYGGSPDKRVSFLQRAAITETKTETLKALCSKHGISIQAVFFAAYAKALASSSQQNDVVFGVYLANRGSQEQLPYPTLCLAPLRVKVPEDSQLVEVAAKIQQDIHSISNAENVSVGLWEVKEWTGVVVESFVNFLSLPGEPKGSANEDSGDGRVQLEQVGFADEATVTNENQAVTYPGQMSRLEKNVVGDAYPDAVDVEVSIQDGGAMDIGVFGSHGKVGEKGGEGLVRMLVDVLRL
ncbi:Hydroxamate-type ferrichrome siderophore peptide synthetase [Cytospora mali]|uniref:Hydroxamate-type ferrichrome siderophore peptide synthetase n=1 Tax=Cytospora mali TaxID=578113 RepID=A0A194V567_CYTMA|nr:Hydroxamate-type ferrichrome siderophore peptide synthetase [Valsa mali var. pyri (nom. inval.)]